MYVHSVSLDGLVVTVLAIEPKVIRLNPTEEDKF
jgi:hypothetical protein